MPAPRTAKKKVSEPIERRIARGEMAEVADEMGLGADYRKLPETWRRNVGHTKVHPPGVELDASLDDDPNRFGIVDEILKRLREQKVEIPCMKAPTTFRRALSSLYLLKILIEMLVKKEPELAPAQRIHEKLRNLGEDDVTFILQQLSSILVLTMNKFNRIEQSLYGFQIVTRALPGHGLRTVVLVHRVICEPKRILVDGNSRNAWACGGTARCSTIDFIQHNPRLLGLEGPDQYFPVYVQPHALAQLRSRLGARPYDYAPQFFMYVSLLTPRMTPVRQGNNLLFECSSPAGRLGYFVVRFHGDHWLVHTFLLLTMDGTPEGEMLQRKLCINRQGVENSRLDRLDTITRSDVRKDPVLSKALRECGCGHLMDAADAHEDFREMKPVANHVRRVLGWMPLQQEVDSVATSEPIQPTIESVGSREFLETAEAA